jgi:predicted tellurium resistance membrane protein TerC
MLVLLESPESWIAFLTLTLLETVLGIDNVIFLSILVGRLPAARQASARIVGLLLAMLTRLALLFSIVWLARLTTPLFSVLQREFSWRDLILGAGGLFLLGKSATEIHHTLEGAAAGRRTAASGVFYVVVIQIALIDVVFSLDSVFTAVGLVKNVAVMAAAIVVAILVIMVVSRSIGAFIARHPTIKMLALAFLILIGFALVAEGIHFEIPKGYLYFAMAFAVGVELINVRLRRHQDRRSERRP